MRKSVNNHTEVQDRINKKIFNLRAERLVREASDNFVYFRDYELALEQVNEVLAIEADHCKALLLKGNILLCLDKDEEALTYFNKAAQVDQYSAVAYGSIASVLDILGRQKEALKYCEKAFEYITAHERHLLPALYDQKIALFLRLKRFEEARETLKKALKNLTEEDSSVLKSSYQGLIESSYKEMVRKREKVSEIALRLVYS